MELSPRLHKQITPHKHTQIYTQIIRCFPVATRSTTSLGRAPPNPILLLSLRAGPPPPTLAYTTPHLLSPPPGRRPLPRPWRLRDTRWDRLTHLVYLNPTTRNVSSNGGGGGYSYIFFSPAEATTFLAHTNVNPTIQKFFLPLSIEGHQRTSSFPY